MGTRHDLPDAPDGSPAVPGPRARTDPRRHASLGRSGTRRRRTGRGPSAARCSTRPPRRTTPSRAAAQGDIGRLPSQAGVRIKSGDPVTGRERVYLAVVIKGPISVPDGLRADAPPVWRPPSGAASSCRIHGVVVVEIAGEEVRGQLRPHRFRPLPNSTAWVLGQDEVRDFLKTEGNIRLGRAFGYEDLEIAFPRGPQGGSAPHRHPGHHRRREVDHRRRPRRAVAGGGRRRHPAGHGGRVHGDGSAGGGPAMLRACRSRAGSRRAFRRPSFTSSSAASAASRSTPSDAFSPCFSSISPYTALEIFELNEAQEERFQKALEERSGRWTS